MLFFIFSFISIIHALLPTYVTTATKYRKDNLTVLGDTYTVGFMDIQFNNKLGVFRSRQFYCANTSCANPNRPCEFCDYTDESICNGTLRSSGPCACVQNTLACRGGSAPDYPYAEHPIPIPPGTTSFIVDVPTQGLVIPYHMLPPDNCSCFVLKQTALIGSVQGNLIWRASDWNGFTPTFILSRWQRNTICPSDPFWGETILIFILNSVDVISSKVRLDVHYYPLPSASVATCTVPSIGNPTITTISHTCLADNVQISYPINTTSGIVRRFVIQPTSPIGLLNLYVSTYIALISTTDPWISLDNASDISVWRRSTRIGELNWPGTMYYDVTNTGGYIYVWTYTLPKIALRILADTSKTWLTNELLNETSIAVTQIDLLATVTIKCGSKSFTPYTNFWSPLETITTGSANVRLFYPSIESTFFYPKPLLSNRGIWDTVSPINPFPTFQEGLIRVGVIIRQRLQVRSQPQKSLPYYPLDYEFLTNTEWNSCGIQFNGLINFPTEPYDPQAAEGTSILDTILASDFNSLNTQCNPQKYFDISNQIKINQNQSTQLINEPIVDTSEVGQTSYNQDVLMASNEFYFCRQQIMGIPILTEVDSVPSPTKECLAKFATPDFDSDPCCYFDKEAPYEDCFLSDRSVENQYEITDWSDEIESCPTNECARGSINNLFIEQNALENPNTCGGSESLTSAQDERVYWNCMDQIFGDEPGTESGPVCFHDDDCQAYEIGTICSSRSKRCLIPVLVAERLFIECLFNNLSQFTRNFISSNLGINSSLNVSISQQWLDLFQAPLPCSDPYNPVGFNLTLDVVGRCDQCIDVRVGKPFNTIIVSAFVFSPGNSFSVGGNDCWNPSTSCTHNIIAQKQEEVCSLIACNVYHVFPLNPFPPILLGLVCPASPDFCGLCEDEFHCINVTNIIPVANCDNNAVLCILANGSYTPTPDASTCQSISSCTASCNGIPCPDEASCVSSGICGDASDYDIGLFTNYWKTDVGGCFFDLRYHSPFDTTLFICDPPFRKTILGCSLFPSSLSTINESTCFDGGFYFGDPSVYQIRNVTWRARATTEPECGNYGKVCLDEIMPSSTNSFQSVYQLPPYDSCVLERDLYLWKPGRWLAGQPRSVRVTQNSFGPRFTGPPRQGLNIPEIGNLVLAARNKIESLEASAESFCRTHFVGSLDASICSCVEGNEEEICFRSGENITSIGVICGQEKSTVTTYGVILEVEEDSLQPDDQCISLLISTPSISYYTDSQITALRTLLVNYREDTEWSFRNEKEAIVGKVLTNGFFGLYDKTSGAELGGATLCLILSDVREKSDPFLDEIDTYPILDVATRLAEDQTDLLRPQNYNVFIGIKINATYFCVNFSTLNTSLAYYMVQRVGDWETRDRQVFETGEIVYLSILLALYALGLMYAGFKFGHLVYVAGIEQFRLGIVMVLMIIFFVFRTVLFSLLLSNSLLGSSSSRAVNYVLFEFPILLFFCFSTNYICIWLVTLSFSKKSTSQQKKNIDIANYGSIVLNLLIFVLFILMIILFETVVDPPKTICAGQVIHFDEDASFALIMAYRIIFSTISIFIGTVLFIVALMFGQLLSDVYFNIPKLTRYRIYAISIIGGLGMITQAIYFLVITVTQTTPSNYVSLSILLVLEIIPAWLFLFVEQVKVGRGNLKSRIHGDQSVISVRTKSTQTVN